MYLIYSGMGSNASCGSGLVYNGQTGHCDYEFNVEKCPNFKGTEEAHEQVANTDKGIMNYSVIWKAESCVYLL